MTETVEMAVYKEPAEREKALNSFMDAPVEDSPVVEAVKKIADKVKNHGDAALIDLAHQFGDQLPEGFKLTPEQVQQAVERLPEARKQVLSAAADNIRAFNQAIMQNMKPVVLDQGEFQVGVDYHPVETVACYVPGGKFPLPSTALMTAVTAQVAGVQTIDLTGPSLTDEVIYAGTLAGVRDFYQLGGAQAIAAFAYGTESVSKVDMVVGPGNAYVTEAKRQLQGLIGIDMLAGPSEVAIIADKTANAQWVAVDMLGQMEHGPDSRAFLVTDSSELVESVQQFLQSELASSDSKYLADAFKNSALFLCDSLDECAQIVNRLAPEHLELLLEQPDELKKQLTHYGSLFMGHYATVAMGDYAAGPNHTLPTNQTARFSGGLNPLTFLRSHTWTKAMTPAGQLGETTRQFAEIEGLYFHGRSVALRQVK